MKGLLTILSSLWFLSLVLLTDNCQPIWPAGSDLAGTLTHDQPAVEDGLGLVIYDACVYTVQYTVRPGREKTTSCL